MPIGFGQTISQPYIVARMTEALLDGPPLKRRAGGGHGLRLPDRGARAAGRAHLQHRAHRRDCRHARALRLKELGVRNVRFKVGDGSMGWRTQAPFDGIIVAAAPLVVPEELIEQLAVNGRLIVPAGPEGKQQLLRIVRREQGIERQVLGSVSFVPLVGGVG